jgi:transposase
LLFFFLKKERQWENTIKKNYQLVTSVKGVGLIVRATMLAYTNNFTSFENWRKFSSYPGIAPFEYESGSSIKKARE